MQQLRREQVRALRLRAHGLTDSAAASVLVGAAAFGLQDTPPGSAALGLAARVPDATSADVRRGLTDDRSIVIAWTRRGSPHLVPSNRLGIFTRGLLPDDEESWRATIAGFVVHLDTLDTSAGDLVRMVADAAHEVLDGRELTKRELGEEIRPLMPAAMRTWFDAEVFARFTAQLTRAASLYGGFVLSPRHGAEATFVRTDQWLDAVPDDDPAQAGAEMARVFVAAYGPTRPQVFAEWAGIGEGHARRVFAGIADELVAVRVEGADGFLLAADAEAIEDIEPAVGVRLLPPHDAYLASLDRRVIVPDLPRHKALWKSAGNPGAVLVDDEIGGSWRARVNGTKLTVDVTEFRSLPRAAHRAIEAQAKRVAAFHGARSAKVTFKI